MKTNFKYFMAAAVLAAGFASCNDNSENGGGVEVGEPATMTISITSPKTYAPEDSVATAAESTVASVDVFVFNSTGSALQVHEAFDAAEITAKKGTIGVQTGDKLVYVGVNLPAELVAAVKGGVSSPTTIGDFTKMKALWANNKFAMMNESKVATTVVAGAANAVTVPVVRLAAKFTVQEKAGLEKTNVSSTTISDLKFAMGQMNSKVYPMQKTAGGFVVDPNSAAGTPANGKANPANYAEFWDEFYTGIPATSAADSVVSTANYVAVNANGTTVSNRNTKYALENTYNDVVGGSPVQTLYKGEITFVSVSAKFVPNKLATYTGGAFSNTTAGAESASTYLVITPSGDHYYFTDATQAGNYATDTNSGAPILYKNNLCYYVVFVNKEEKHQVFRNEYYNVTINAITSIGNPDPEITDPGNKPAEDADLEVTVDVKNWTMVEENVDLSKD